MQQILLEKLQSDWKGILSDQNIFLLTPISLLQISSGRNKDRKIVFLVFNFEDNRPIMVIKIARISSYDEQIKREYHTLKSLWKIPEMRPSIPQPIGLFEINDNLVMLERSLQGTSLRTMLIRREKIRYSRLNHDICKTQEWLNLLHGVTRSNEKKIPTTNEIEKYFRSFTQTTKIGLPDGFSKKLLVFAEECQQIQIPLVGCHSDIHPGNIIIGEDAFGIIDWEDYCSGSPYDDFFNFIVLYSQQYPWNGWRLTNKPNSFKYTFLENSKYSEMIKNSISNALETVGLPAEFAHLFFSIFLLQKAMPTSDQGQKRNQQAPQWQNRLNWYASNEKDSIFL